MADDGDWFGAGDDEPPPVVKPLKKKGKEPTPPPETAPAEPGEAPAQGTEDKREEDEDDEYLDPDKLLLFKHWIRPKFLSYKYLYMYRKNYYDDVMDYLEKRSRGIKRELPHAETWAERMLRTYSNKVNQYRMFTKRIQQDLEMVEKTKMSGNFFYYHVKNTFDKQFSPLLY
ncbi:flightin isoform X1 [Leptinotarsa decemlineata]|uniref:flightin isoform X1 n=1 Tax=Leptinotarsa decemlineata TaxID=7539 RepID=UPI003D306028